MDTNLKDVKKNVDDVDQEISAARVDDVMSIKKAEMEIHKV